MGSRWFLSFLGALRLQLFGSIGENFGSGWDDACPEKKFRLGDFKPKYAKQRNLQRVKRMNARHELGLRPTAPSLKTSPQGSRSGARGAPNFTPSLSNVAVSPEACFQEKTWRHLRASQTEFEAPRAAPRTPGTTRGALSWRVCSVLFERCEFQRNSIDRYKVVTTIYVQG